MARRAERSWQVSFEPSERLRERAGIEVEEHRRRSVTGPVCPGACNARHRRAMEALDAYEAELKAWEENPIGSPPSEPEVSESRPWVGDPVLCPRCQSQVRTELAELSDLAAIMDSENLGLRKGPGSDRVSGSRHAPSPSPAADDLDELAAWLRDWQAVAMEVDETPPRTGFLMSEIATLCSRLSSLHFTKLMANVDVAADFGREVRQWHRRMASTTRSGTGRHQKGRPCPRCDRYSLVWTEGDEYVACQTPTCQRLMTLDEYEQYDALFDSIGPASEATRKRASLLAVA